VRDLWPWLLLLLVPAAVRAAGRALAAPRLGMRVDRIRLGLGPAILRRTSASGIAWTLGVVPLPLLRVGPADPRGAGTLRRRAALALTGPVAVYLAAGVLVTGTVLARGEALETNVVAEVVDEGPAAAGGLRTGDVIVAVDGRSTPDGARIRHFLTWVDGDDGDVHVTIARGPAQDTLSIHAHPDHVLPVAPDLGIVLRIDRPRTGVLAALRLGLAFPATEGSALRWLADVIVARLALHLRDYPVTYVPSLRRRSWPLELADLMGLFALVSLCPWPGLDGGELVLVAYRWLRGRQPAAWFEGLFRSGAWGATMALMVALATVLGSVYLDEAIFDHRTLPRRTDSLSRWPG
jgi:membrane-associated protease RseP (regulator of RpoE activity)